MPTIDIADAHDEGSQAIGSNVSPLAISWTITTDGRMLQARSVGPPRRVMHVGWIGVGRAAGPFGLPQIQWAKYVEWDTEYIVLAPLQIAPGRIQWALQLGNHLHIQFYY